MFWIFGLVLVQFSCALVANIPAINPNGIVASGNLGNTKLSAKPIPSKNVKSKVLKKSSLNVKATAADSDSVVSSGVIVPAIDASEEPTRTVSKEEFERIFMWVKEVTDLTRNSCTDYDDRIRNEAESLLLDNYEVIKEARLLRASAEIDSERVAKLVRNTREVLAQLHEKKKLAVIAVEKEISLLSHMIELVRNAKENYEN